jgi:hypothetical protein
MVCSVPETIDTPGGVPNGDDPKRESPEPNRPAEQRKAEERDQTVDRPLMRFKKPQCWESEEIFHLLVEVSKTIPIGCADERPAHVTEPPAPIRRMRIPCGIAVAVVRSVECSPSQRTAFPSGDSKEREARNENRLGTKGSMCERTVKTEADSNSRSCRVQEQQNS